MKYLLCFCLAFSPGYYRLTPFWLLHDHKCFAVGPLSPGAVITLTGLLASAGRVQEFP